MARTALKEREPAAVVNLAERTNGAEDAIEINQPYRASVTVVGTADLLFHRWNAEAVDEKAKAKKGSEQKKTDQVESYVYRNDDKLICMPGEYLRQAIIHAAKYQQDPRSPRKSAMDLFKAGVVSLTALAPIIGRGGQTFSNWEYEDRRRVVVQRAGVNRTRPAFKEGWSAEVEFMVLLPEYIDAANLHAAVSTAGRLIGLADFRPTYGRFNVSKFEVLRDD